jgi:hypothetical protein
MIKVERGSPLTLELQATIDGLLSVLSLGQGEQALSDSTFANLFLFRAVHRYRFLGGNWPCISGRSYDGLTHLLPLFDLRTAPPEVLFDLLYGYGGFFPLSGFQLEGLDPQRFGWTASRDDADYVYPAHQFVNYRGRLLQKKRNLVKQLHNAHVVTAQLFTAEAMDEALNVLKQWMHAKGKSTGQADDNACRDALKHSSTLGLEGFVYRVNNEAVGFLLFEMLKPGVCVIRFAKALDRFKGIYQHMFQHLCHARQEIQWLNFEQDMGIANLRHTKLSYQPAWLLPKYRVYLR